MKTKYKNYLPVLILLTATACNLGSEKSQENQLKVEANEMFYSKKELHLKQNTPYNLKFENKGKLVHDWNVAEMPVKDVVKKMEQVSHSHHRSSKHNSQHSSNLHIAADSNSTSEIAFTILKPGVYEYYCSVPGHKEAGMIGTIFVHK